MGHKFERIFGTGKASIRINRLQKQSYLPGGCQASSVFDLRTIWEALYQSLRYVIFDVPHELCVAAYFTGNLSYSMCHFVRVMHVLHAYSQSGEIRALQWVYGLCRGAGVSHSLPFCPASFVCQPESLFCHDIRFFGKSQHFSRVLVELLDVLLGGSDER